MPVALQPLSTCREEGRDSLGVPELSWSRGWMLRGVFSVLSGHQGCDRTSCTKSNQALVLFPTPQPGKRTGAIPSDGRALGTLL